MAWLDGSTNGERAFGEWKAAAARDVRAWHPVRHGLLRSGDQRSQRRTHLAAGYLPPQTVEMEQSAHHRVHRAARPGLVRETDLRIAFRLRPTGGVSPQELPHPRKSGDHGQPGGAV